MSKASYFLMGLIVTALLYMGAVRAYQVYERTAQERAAQQIETADEFKFQNKPIMMAAPQARPVNRPIAFDPSQTAIFLEEAPLTEEQKTQQAIDTISSILDDYESDPRMQQFNQNLSVATQGEVSSLSDLSGAGLAGIMRENPQVGQVVQDSMKNPEFANLIQQIFTNPQFINSVKQLQGPQAQPPAADSQSKKAEQ